MGDIQMISIAVLEDEDEFAKTLMGHIHQYSIEMKYTDRGRKIL